MKRKHAIQNAMIEHYIDSGKFVALCHINWTIIAKKRNSKRTDIELVDNKMGGVNISWTVDDKLQG